LVNTTYATDNIEIKIILDGNKILVGTVNMLGYDRFSDFIELDDSRFLKLSKVILGGNKYNFLMLNKSKILGYLEK